MSMSMQPRGNPRASWPSNDDMTVFNFIVIAIGLGVGAYLLWTYHHAEISAAVMSTMHAEIGVIHHFTDRYDVADQQMAASDPSDVTLGDLYGILHAVGLFFRVPATVSIVVLAIACLLRAAPSRYKRAFDREGLIEELAKSFPVCAAFVRRQLRLVRPGEVLRPADYALTPREWIERNAIGRDGLFDAARAESALVAQLGPRWAGPEGGPPAARFLFVVFGLHLAERRDEAADLLGTASASLANRKKEGPEGPLAPLALEPAVLAGADALLADKSLFEEARAVAARHAFTVTALMGLLNAARVRAGVLAPAQFAWLKLVDRSLWYALHSLGFESEGIGRYLHPNARAEAAGARDHWAAECGAEGPVMRPSVQRAVQAMRRYSPRVIPPGGGRGQSDASSVPEGARPDA